MPIPQTSPASLDNTLSGMDAQSQSDAMAQALQQALAQHAAEAAQQAQQAGQQYQQAASAPLPDINGLQALIPQLFSNVASVIGREPSYRENAQDTIKQQRSDLLKARAENLQALQDTFAQKASAAKAAGDVEAEQNALLKREQISKTLAQLLEKQHHEDALALEDRKQANSLEQIAARGAQSRQTNAAKPDSTSSDNMDFLNQSIITTSRGTKILDASGMTPTDMTKAKRWAAENGVRLGDQKTMDKLHNVEGARTNLQAMANQAAEILPPDWKSRIGQYGGITLSNVLHTNPTRSAFNTWRIQAIKQLTAIAGGMGSGLRVNQAEILQAVKNDIPTIHDDLPTAMQKINNVLAMLDRNEDPYLSQDWRKEPSVGTITPQTGGAQAEKPKGPGVRVIGPKGQLREIDAADLPEAIKRGWKRSK